MTMIISEERDGAATVLVVQGRVDSLTADGFGERLNEALDRKTGPVVIDCGEMNYLNSAGIRVLLLAAKRCRSDGSKLVLFGVGSNVMEVLQICGLLQILPVHTHRASALAAVV